MKIKTIAQWLFVYLPLRFTVPLIGLLAWFLFYLWPWLLDVFFPSEPAGDLRSEVRRWLVKKLVPVWIDYLNLTPAIKAAGVLTLLLLGVLTAYNVAAIIYELIRRWPRPQLTLGTLLFNLFIYSYPWLFAPKDWKPSEIQWRNWAPFFVRGVWSEGLRHYGILWFLPGAVMVGILVNELIARQNKTKASAIRVARAGSYQPPVESVSFQKLKDELGPDMRIGLILAGGGAKGVYQAGSMRAIYEFLKSHACLDSVKMIAGTSIGSWNTLFWLADKVGPETDGISCHEKWWQTADVARLIAFEKYIPFTQNSLLSNRPWRENFDELFSRGPLQAQFKNDKAMHFYLTRSNVAQGRLEFSTNWGHEERERALQSDDIEVDSFTEARDITALKEAVFASMDCPPMFPYQKIGYEYFEDGGVIDNLPIRFGALVENCDLIFVLALNASFEQAVEQHSIIERLARVTDVRQGVLERNSMRLTYLYNHINLLREVKGKDGVSSSAAVKSDKLMRVFAICPNQPLVVNTTDFYKTAEFGPAFHTMYQATRVELSRFDFTAVPSVKSEDTKDWLRMALVSPAGEITYNYRF